jgi:hypothetical protein
VYSQGIPKTRLFEEAKRVFVDRDLSGKYGELAGQTLTGFFKLNKFALVVDLRTVNDFKFYGNGAKILNTCTIRILVEITKRATTANVLCHMFVLSDGLINIVNGQLQSVQY